MALDEKHYNKILLIQINYTKIYFKQQKKRKIYTKGSIKQDYQWYQVNQGPLLHYFALLRIIITCFLKKSTNECIYHTFLFQSIIFLLLILLETPRKGSSVQYPPVQLSTGYSFEGTPIEYFYKGFTGEKKQTVPHFRVRSTDETS